MGLLGSVLDCVGHGLSDAGGFVNGVGEGACDGVKGTVSGVGHLAADGYKLATDSHYREQVWNSAVNDAKAAANFAQTAVTDPGKAADEIGNTASHAWLALETAYNQAAARGQGIEFIGQIFGQGAILAGTAFIPGGAAADGVEGMGDAGRATALLGDAGKLGNATEDAGRVGTLTGDAEAGAPLRPSWRASELNVGARIESQGYRAQVSFKDGVEVPYGTKGSVRPEYYKPGSSIEVKNYSLETERGRENLVRNVSGQAVERAKNLPPGTKQNVYIDVRGQGVSRADLNAMIKRIVQRSNGAIQPNNINFLR